MRYMAAEDEIVYRGWVTYQYGPTANHVRTAYFGPYSKESTARGVVSNEIRILSYQRKTVLARGVHEARFEWKPTDDSGS